MKPGRHPMNILHAAGGQVPDPPPQPRLAAETSTSADQGKPINILIVDDEPRNLFVLEAILDDPGYRLIRAESGDQALLALIKEEFALLILDIRMPGMTGFELAQMIKERKKTARVPIIFLTAYYNEDQHMLAGYGAGAVDYLHKPVNQTILRSKVAVFAELHRKNRQCETANCALLAEVIERRRTETELTILAGKLIQAQEEERRRIARDLHDDFNQRLAVLSLELALIERALVAPPEPIPRQLTAIRTQVVQLSHDLEDLAHKLHPPLLEHVGLEIALRDHVAQFTKQTGLPVTCIVREVPGTLPPEIATALFRVMQESLQNVRKHAQATAVTVRLSGSSKGIGVSVSDNGKGFEVERPAAQRTGIGLMSMHERARLLGGYSTIRSGSTHGTTVCAWIPLSQEAI
ncbi:MAG: response regulator [Nitrospiraceae bacterium]